MTFPFYNPVTVQDPVDDSNPATKVYVDNGLGGKAESGHDHNATYSALGHTHTSAAIVSGTLDIARIPTGTTGSTVPFGNDSRFTDARTPTAHASTHATGQSDAIAPSDIGASAVGHAHAGADITSGTVNIARIPTGTTGSTVPFGNDARFTDARTPTAHVHAGADITSGTVPIAAIPTGTTGSTVPFGNDSRFTDARTPTSHVHSGADITSGTVPIAAIPTGTSGTTVSLGNHAHAGADITSGTVAYARLPTGTTASTVAAGDDSRITGAVQTSRTITAGTGLTGGGDLSANRTLTVAYGTTSTTAAVGNDTRLSVKPYPPVTLTDASTVAVDASLGTHFRLTGTTTRIMGTPTNPTDGQVITFEIKASSGTPNHTWASGYAFGSDVTGTTALVAGKTDYVQFVYASSVSKWQCIGYVKGYTT